MLALINSQFSYVDATADGVLALGYVASEMGAPGDLAAAKKHLMKRCEALKRVSDSSGQYVASLISQLAAPAIIADANKARDATPRWARPCSARANKALWQISAFFDRLPVRRAVGRTGLDFVPQRPKLGGIYFLNGGAYPMFQAMTMTTRKFLLSAALGLSVAVAGPAALAAEPTVHQVFQAAEAGRYIEAQAMLDEVLKAHPTSAVAHYVQAQVPASIQELRDKIAAPARQPQRQPCRAAAGRRQCGDGAAAARCSANCRRPAPERRFPGACCWVAWAWWPSSSGYRA